MNPSLLTHLPKSKLTQQPVLHFVHANGFTSACYQPMLQVLAKFFSIESMDLLGTNPEYPIDKNWQSLTHQVAHSIEQACQKHQVASVVAVGHSLGAVTSLQALLQNSQYISHAILLDPAILTGKHGAMYQLGGHFDDMIQHINNLTNLNTLKKQKHTNPNAWQNICLDKLSPAGRASRRRDVFTTRQHAYKSLRNKALFAKFDERCFELYIQHGLTETADGSYTLSIPKANESEIFRTMPSWYWRRSIHPKRPVCFIIGQDSYFTHIGSFDKFAKAGFLVCAVAGSHMFPLEYPEDCAQQILKNLSQLIAKNV